MRGKKGLTTVLAVLLALLTAYGAAGTVSLLRPREASGAVEILQYGRLLYRVDPGSEADRGDIVIECENGTNTVRVDGEGVRVVYADCPDRCCVKAGLLTRGMPLVCVPHGLVVRCAQEEDGTDAVSY